MKHSIKTKILCSILSVLLVMQIIPWNVMAIENEFSHSIAENISVEEENISIICEVPEMRDQFSKTYLLEDGCYYTVSNSEPIHKMENGNWVEIISTTASPEDMDSAVEMVEFLAESTSTSSNARIIVNDNNPSPVVGRYIDTSGVLQSTHGLWLKLTGLETATETKLMVTTSAKLIVNCQKIKSGILKAYTVSSEWDDDVNYTLGSTIADGQMALQKNDRIEDYHEISSTANYEFDITDICSKWERGIEKNNGVVLSFDGTSGMIRIGGYTFARKYRIFSELDEGFSYHSVDMGKAGTVYINDYTNTVLLKRDEMGLGGETMPITISRYFDFGRDYSLSNPAGMAGRFNYKSSIYKLSELTYAWDMISGNTLYFSPTSETENSLNKWISSEDENIILWVNNSLSYGGDFSENYIVYAGDEYYFNKVGNLISIKNIETNNKITISYDNSNYIEHITDTSGRIYKFTRKTVGGFSVYTDLSVYKNSTDIVQIDDEDLKIKYSYISHTDNQQVLLNKVTYQDDSFVEYEYSGNNLVKITDTDGSVLELDYFVSADGNTTNILTGYKKYLLINNEEYIIESLDIDNSNTYRRVFSDLSGETLVLQFNKNLDLTGKRDNEGNAYYISYDSDDNIEHYIVPEDATNVIKNGDFESGILEWTPQSTSSGEITSTSGNNALKLNFNLQDAEYYEQLVELTNVEYTGVLNIGFKVQGTSLTPKSNSFVGIEIYAYDEEFTLLDHDGNVADEDYVYYSIGIDNTTSDIQYIMGAFDVCEEIEYLFVYLISRNQINNVVFDDIVLYPSNLIISTQKEDSQFCACGSECNYGDGCPCECENLMICNCVSCKSYQKDDYIYNNSTNKLEYIEHQSSDGTKSMNSSTYYDINGNYITKETDENGNTIEYNHDIYTGLLNSKTTANGTITYGYNSVGLLTEVTQTITPITASSEENIIEISNIYSYDYDRIETITHNGFTYEFTYDAFGNCSAVKAEDTILVSYSKDDIQNEIIYADGYKIRYIYNDGKIEKIYENDSTDALYEYYYDENGYLQKIIDNVNGLTTEYNCTTTVGYKEYQKAGVFDIIVYRNNNNRDVRYAKLDMEDGTYEYYAEEEYTIYDTVTNYDCETGITTSSTRTDYAYDSSLITISSTDAFGRRINPENSVSVNDGPWNESISASNTILEKYGSGLPAAKSETYYYYDDTDTQAFSEVAGYSNTVSGFRYYNTYRNLDYLYDLSLKWGNDYQFIYENDNKIVKIYSVSDSQTLVARYEYNDAGQIIREDYEFNELNNPEEFYLYTYDVRGKVSSVNPHGYHYDTDKETILTEYNYSTVNIVFNESSQTYYSYYISTWSNQYSYEYDDCGNITKIFNGLEASSENLIAQYHYDEAQQLVREDDSRLNKTYTYTYDAGGNLTSKNEYAYTTEGLGDIVDAKQYVYDDTWNDKLVGFDGKNLVYDTENNRYIYGDPTNTNGEEYRYYEWQGNQLISCSIFNRDNITTSNEKIVYTYNEDGLRSSKTIYNYATNSSGVLLTNENGEYYIDEKETGTRTEYLWENGKLVYVWLSPKPIDETRDNDLAGNVREQDAALTIKYLYDENDEPYGMITNEHNIFYFVKNMQGDVERVVSASEGVRMVTYQYDAWGNMTYTLNLSTIETALASMIMLGNNVITYRGYMYDYETDLYYLQSRYYSPEWGRFLSADDFRNLTLSPKDIHSVNVFLYCFNNPIKFTDNTGEWPSQYPVPKWTSKGFSIGVIGDFLRKNYCTDYSKAVIKEKGRYGYYKTMDDQRIASEIYAHAMIYYSSSAIKNSKLYKNKTVKSLIDSLRGKANPIDVNYDEKFYRILGFNLIWNLT